MLYFDRRACAVAAALWVAQPAYAQDSEIAQLKSEIRALKESYEARIQSLETRLTKAETAAPAPVAAATPGATASAGNAFNPEISLVLSGLYRNFSQDPNQYAITGFPAGRGAEVAPGKRGLSLAETELNFSASVDPYFFGSFTMAVSPDGSVGVEEAFVQTLALPRGFTVKGGRFFSALGYQNSQHAHVWDFIDAPLVYQAFLGRQYVQDGVQAKWIAPTSTFVELGLEAGRGDGYPGTERNSNGAGSIVAFGHVGGDIGDYTSWRLGLSLLHARPQDRVWEQLDRNGINVANSLSGTSKVAIADAVLKYYPTGSTRRNAFKLQGEYMHRREKGSLTYDADAVVSGPLASAYNAAQSGWYLQGIYQLNPRWRFGARTERLSSGTVDFGINDVNLAQSNYRPSRHSLIAEYSPTEFSRFRLEFSRDLARENLTDNQISFQYLMNIGAHGAHPF